jgi:hypothetical protein
VDGRSGRKGRERETGTTGGRMLRYERRRAARLLHVLGLARLRRGSQERPWIRQPRTCTLGHGCLPMQAGTGNAQVWSAQLPVLARLGEEQASESHAAGQILASRSGQGRDPREADGLADHGRGGDTLAGQPRDLGKPDKAL